MLSLDLGAVSSLNKLIHCIQTNSCLNLSVVTWGEWQHLFGEVVVHNFRFFVFLECCSFFILLWINCSLRHTPDSFTQLDNIDMTIIPKIDDFSVRDSKLGILWTFVLLWYEAKKWAFLALLTIVLRKLHGVLKVHEIFEYHFISSYTNKLPNYPTAAFYDT